MKSCVGNWLAGASLAAGAWLIATARGPAGNGKDHGWQHVEPEAAYKVMLGRNSRAMQTYLDSKDREDLRKAQVEAVRVAALTLSIKGGEAGRLAAVRQRALI